MRKKIGNSIIKINNFPLIEKGLDGIFLESLQDNTYNIKTYNNILEKSIKYYKEFISIVPFPLYAIEDDIKYYALGVFIRNKLYTYDNIIVSSRIYDGLYIFLGNGGKALKFKGFTWSIIEVSEMSPIPLCSSDIKDYKRHIGYKEYKWLVNKFDKIENKDKEFEENEFDFEDWNDLDDAKEIEEYEIKFEDTEEIVDEVEENIFDFEDEEDSLSDDYLKDTDRFVYKYEYFDKFQSEIFKALDYDIEETEEALKKLTSFYDVPKNIEKLKSNYITNNKNNKKYILDIFSVEDNRKYKDKGHIVVKTENYLQKDYKEIKLSNVVHDYTIFEKKDNSKLTEVKAGKFPGFINLFIRLLEDKKDNESSFSDYRGILVSNNLFYEVDNNIFICKANKISSSNLIDTESTIYCYQDDFLYYKKLAKVGKSIIKEKIYRYSFLGDYSQLCKISYKVV